MHYNVVQHRFGVKRVARTAVKRLRRRSSRPVPWSLFILWAAPRRGTANCYRLSDPTGVAAQILGTGAAGEGVVEPVVLRRLR
jgi:hypothetical protein